VQDRLPRIDTGDHLVGAGVQKRPDHERLEHEHERHRAEEDGIDPAHPWADQRGGDQHHEQEPPGDAERGEHDPPDPEPERCGDARRRELQRRLDEREPDDQPEPERGNDETKRGGGAVHALTLPRCEMTRGVVA